MNTQVSRRAESREVLAAVIAEIDRRSVELVSILPRDVPLEEFKRVTLNAVQENPRLLGCTFKSLFSAITRCAREGWVPDGRLCYFDVRRNSKTGEEICVFIPGVHGYLKNTIGVTLDDWRGGVVREGDDYEIELGDHERFVLRVDPFTRDEDRPIIGAYSIAWLPGAKQPSRQFMSMKQLMAAKSKSASANGERPQYSPWNTHPEDMYIKTVMKKHANRLPVDRKMAEILHEERELDKGDLIDQQAPRTRSRQTPTQQLEQAANGHAGEEADRRPLPTPEREQPRQETQRLQPQQPARHAAQPAAVPSTRTSTQATVSGAATSAPDEPPVKRGPGRPPKQQSAPQQRQNVKPPADDHRQRDIEDDAERDQRGDAQEELDPIETARLAGEAAYEDGNPRTPPAHYQDGHHMDELDAWYEGWDDMDEGQRGAARAMA